MQPLNAFPDEEKSAFECGFPLSNRGMGGIGDGVEELRDLVDTKQCISVENERKNNLTG
jgi:hypothetical protein